MSRRAGPRIRSVKPERYQDERFAGVSRDARHLYDGLTTQADDEGRGTANLALLRANLLPFDGDATPDVIGAWLGELEAAGLVTVYAAVGRSYFAITSWADDQRVDRPTPSTIPPPDLLANPREDSRALANVPASHAPADRDRDQDQTGAEDARERASLPPGDVRRVFDEWVTATERDASKTQLTPDRRRRIEKALRSHGLEDCLAAVRNIGADAWARGANDRGRRFDDVEHALGSAERIERWRDQAPRAQLAAAGRPASARDDLTYLDDGLQDAGAASEPHREAA